MRIFKKILSLFLIVFVFKFAHLAANNGKDINSIKEKFSKVLLVINFNHPYYSNIEFLKALYSPYFSNIIFYGEKEDDQVIAVPTNTGYLLAPVIQDACVRFPHFKGYLFLQDDCVLHVWNLLNLDHNKIWYAVKWQDGLDSNNKFYSIRNINGYVASGYSWFKWEYPSGLPAARAAHTQLTNKELDLLHRNLGHNNVAGAMCEVFYVPARFRDSFLRLNSIFKNVFCEIAIPTMLCCLDLLENWEHLTMLGGAGVGVGSPGSPMLINYPTNVSWVHPIKFSYKENRERVLNMFRNILY